MEKMIFFLFLTVFTISVQAQIIVPLDLPDNCNYNVGNREIPVRDAAMNIKLIPNPNSGIFTLYIESPVILGNTQIEIFNSVGIKCFQMPVYTDSQNLIRKMEIKDLPNGVYFLKVSTNKKEVNTTFTILD